MSRSAEALDLLRQAGRVVCDAAPSNDADTLRRVMKFVESARVALAEEPATPPRSAEEIAREMLPSMAQPGHVRISDGCCDAWVTFADETDINALRDMLRRLIERSRVDGAAAERERVAAQAHAAQFYAAPEDAAAVWAKFTGKPAPAQPRFCSCGHPRPLIHGALCKCRDCDGFCDLAEAEPDGSVALAEQQPRDAAARTWAGRVRDDGSVVIYTGNAPVASLGAAEVQSLLDELAAKPRDLAGRIRALVQEYAGRELDACAAGESAVRVSALRVARAHLADAHFEAVRHGRVSQHWFDQMRSGREATSAFEEARRKAADEVEAIVRGCEEGQQR